MSVGGMGEGDCPTNDELFFNAGKAGCKGSIVYSKLFPNLQHCGPVTSCSGEMEGCPQHFISHLDSAVL